MGAPIVQKSPVRLVQGVVGLALLIAATLFALSNLGRLPAGGDALTLPTTLFIVAVAATIHPISVAWGDVAITLAFGVVALAFAYPARSGFLGRRRGLLLLVLYAVYLAALIQRQT